MSDFTAEEALLRLVASGNAEIAELLRLRSFVPSVFTSEKIEAKYAEIIHDFSYFQKSDAIMMRLSSSAELVNLDAKFCDDHIEILTRFYQSFESIHLYVLELKSILQELKDGLFIQQTLESVFQNDEGRQLLVESLYLYGVMLLVVDKYIPHLTRERLLVSYYRYRTETQGESTIDEVCKLLRSTEQDWKMGIKRSSNTYPEDYFCRIAIDEQFVEMVIGHLRSDDIYHQVPVYPMPEHRTTALATQGAMLYVCLFFSSATLHKGEARMREIVDKFFPDNWVVSIYMGITVNLIESWAPFKAAKMALNNSIATSKVKEVAAAQRDNMHKALSQVRNVLKDCNQLSESFLIKNMAKMIGLLTRCNVMLRWFVLHTSETEIGEKKVSKDCEKISKLVWAETGCDKKAVFEGLQIVSQLEVRVRQITRTLLDEKELRWSHYMDETTERIGDLISAFSGEKPLLKITVNEELQKWFQEINADIKLLSVNDVNASERKIIHIIKALEGVQQFHNLDANMQVKQHLTESLDYLHRMLHTLSITEETLIRIQIVGDISYAWILIDQYTDVMRASIANPPYLVINLRDIFLKLSTALEIPLLRINQAKSDDLESVSHYYSYQLVDYVRRVVNIIPKNIFQLITQKIYDETQAMKELPTRIKKSSLRDFAQLNHRKCISSVAENVTALTEGILQMRKTLVGVVEVDPKELLEDGVRKELRVHLHNVIRRDLWFTERQAMDMKVKMDAVIQLVNRYRWSFEYVQDYLHINGSKIFEEEMSRMVNDCVEFEKSEMMATHNPNGANIKFRNHATETSQTFIGNFARTLLLLTDPMQSIYLDRDRQWVHINGQKTAKERFSMRTISQLSRTIGPVFLVGIDMLYSQIIFSELEDFMASLKFNILVDPGYLTLLNSLRHFQDDLYDTLQYEQLYAKIQNAFSTKTLTKYVSWIYDMGRIQLLRNELTLELSQMCRVSSQQLEHSLHTLNNCLIHELQNPCADKPKPDTDMLFEVNQYLVYAGLQRPTHKVYVLLDEKISSLCASFLFVIIIKSLKRLRSSSQRDMDDMPFVAGLATILQQMNAGYVEEMFVKPMCRYIRHCMDVNVINDSEDHRNDFIQSTVLLRSIVKLMHISKDVVDRHCPSDVCEAFEMILKCGYKPGVLGN